MKIFDWNSIKQSRSFIPWISIIESDWDGKIGRPLPEKLVKLLKLEGARTPQFASDEFVQGSLLPELGDTIYLSINLSQFTREDQALIKTFFNIDIDSKIRYIVEVKKTTWVLGCDNRGTVGGIEIGVKLLSVFIN